GIAWPARTNADAGHPFVWNDRHRSDGTRIRSGDTTDPRLRRFSVARQPDDLRQAIVRNGDRERGQVQTIPAWRVEIPPVCRCLRDMLSDDHISCRVPVCVVACALILRGAKRTRLQSSIVITSY